MGINDQGTPISGSWPEMARQEWHGGGLKELATLHGGLRETAGDYISGVQPRISEGMVPGSGPEERGREFGLREERLAGYDPGGETEQGG
jgi:hypothetical protein